MQAGAGNERSGYMRNIVKGGGAESESRADRDYVVEEDDYEEEEET